MKNNVRTFDLIVLYKGYNMPSREEYYHISFYEDKRYYGNDLSAVYDSIRLNFKKADYIIVLENNVVVDVLKGEFKI